MYSPFQRRFLQRSIPRPYYRAQDNDPYADTRTIDRYRAGPLDPTRLRCTVPSSEGFCNAPFRDLTIGPKTMTRMQTPERSIVTVRDRWIPHGFDVQSLPAKVFATLHSATLLSGPRQ